MSISILFAIAVKIEQDFQDWMDWLEFVLNGSWICWIERRLAG
jgi:hypothetical protein